MRRRKERGEEYPVELKRSAVARVAAGERVKEVARDLKVAWRRVYEWRAKCREEGDEAFRGRGRPRKAMAAARARLKAAGEDELSSAKRQIAELERKIGQQQVDLDFFRQALQLVQDRQRASGGPGGRRSTKSSKR